MRPFYLFLLIEVGLDFKAKVQTDLGLLCTDAPQVHIHPDDGITLPNLKKNYSKHVYNNLVFFF